jgi:hypothetical protein
MRDFPAAASAGESRSAVRIDDRRYLGIPFSVESRAQQLNPVA